MFPKGFLISRQEAARLVQSGEWVSDLTIHNEIWEGARAIQESWGDWGKEGDKLMVRAMREGADATMIFGAFRTVVDEAYAKRSETKVLEPPPPDYTPALRIWEHAVYKVQPTAQNVLRDGLRFVMAISTTPYSLLMWSWVGVEFANLIRLFWEGFERIEHPDEQQVLEAIHRLSAKVAVVNHDALKDETFDRAYGFIAPDAKQLVSELAGKLEEAEIVKALLAMKHRNILQERQGRWSIAF